MTITQKIKSKSSKSGSKTKKPTASKRNTATTAKKPVKKTTERTRKIKTTRKAIVRKGGYRGYFNQDEIYTLFQGKLNEINTKCKEERAAALTAYKSARLSNNITKLQNNKNAAINGTDPRYTLWQRLINKDKRELQNAFRNRQKGKNADEYFRSGNS